MLTLGVQLRLQLGTTEVLGLLGSVMRVQFMLESLYLLEKRLFLRVGPQELDLQTLQVRLATQRSLEGPLHRGGLAFEVIDLCVQCVCLSSEVLLLRLQGLFQLLVDPEQIIFVGERLGRRVCTPLFQDADDSLLLSLLDLCEFQLAPGFEKVIQKTRD